MKANTERVLRISEADLRAIFDRTDMGLSRYHDVACSAFQGHVDRQYSDPSPRSNDCSCGLSETIARIVSLLQEEREREIRTGLTVIYTALRSDEKGEFWAVRRWLDKQGVFNDDLSGLRVVEAAAKQLLSRLASSSSPSMAAEKAESDET